MTEEQTTEEPGAFLTSLEEIRRNADAFVASARQSEEWWKEHYYAALRIIARITAGQENRVWSSIVATRAASGWSRKQITKHHQRAELLAGKWRAVKEENNTLRRQNEALRARVAELEKQNEIITALAGEPALSGHMWISTGGQEVLDADYSEPLTVEQLAREQEAFVASVEGRL